MTWTISPQGAGFKVTLVGTGCPPPAMNRFGPSTLVEVQGQKFLFDAGRGALQRLAQLKVQWQEVEGYCSRTSTPITSSVFPTCG